MSSTGAQKLRQAEARARGLRICWRCGLEKKPTDFYSHGSYCKPCWVAYGSDWRRRNPEYRARQQALALQPARRRNSRAWYLHHAFGLTPEKYLELWDKGGGACHICGRPFPPEGRAALGLDLSDIHVDHDHFTGRVRGLLCGHCNRGLGHFRDVPESLERAAAYLRV